MDRHLALMSRPQQLSAFIVSAFGVLALTLAAVGLYGVVSYSVAQRTREIGIRMALGADAPRVVRQLVAGGLKLLVVGGALGLTLAVAATRLLVGLLFEVDALARVITKRSYGCRTCEAMEVVLYHALGNLPEPELAHRFC